MTDYSELVKFLRWLNPWAFPAASYKRMQEAADAIETLTRQVENLERALRRDGEWQSTRN